MAQKNRFEVVVKEGSALKNSGLRQIIVDKETGVNYLWMLSGHAGGLTVLLDKDGKPMISNVIDK